MDFERQENTLANVARQLDLPNLLLVAASAIELGLLI